MELSIADFKGTNKIDEDVLLFLLVLLTDCIKDHCIVHISSRSVTFHVFIVKPWKLFVKVLVCKFEWRKKKTFLSTNIFIQKYSIRGIKTKFFGPIHSYKPALHLKPTISFSSPPNNLPPKRYYGLFIIRSL